MTGKKVLVLGSGRVSRPCVQYILAKGHSVILVDVSEANVKRTLMGHASGVPVIADAVAEAGNLIREHKPDVVACLLPGAYTSDIVKICVNCGVSMVVASYVTEDIKKLDGEAVGRGIKILCEVGLDPGIDHMSAASSIRKLRNEGGKIEGFWSVCGALPDIGSNTNPIGYKLSWAPESLIGASLRSAKIMEDGHIVDLPGGVTFQRPSFHEIPDLGWFEAYANANSLPYIEAYGIPEVRNIYRGTLRYPGWCDMITQMQKLGLFDTERRNLAGHTYASVVREITGCMDASEPVIDCAARFLKLENHSLAIKKLEWLGLFDETKLPFESGSLRELVSELYSGKLQFSRGERDLIVMQHRYDVSYSGSRRKTHVSTLISRGDVDGDTAIAKTTGIPIGIAVHLIVTGAVKKNGVIMPTTEDIYAPSLRELANEGISFTEEIID